MKLEELFPGIVHVSMPTRQGIASVMMRFQEYYESPNPLIRGQIFTIGFIRSQGRDGTGLHTYEGGKTYTSDWSGYNFPSYVMDPFIRGLFDPLTPHEQDLVEALRCRQGRYYVIGTSEECEAGAGALDHEICHALYYINPAYKKAVDKVLDAYRPQLKNLRKALISIGYAEEVLDDECHAWMSADYDWFFANRAEAKTFNVQIPREMHLKLRKIKAKYMPEEK